MLRETTVARAMLYQWRLAVAIFVCVLALLQLLRAPVISRFPERWNASLAIALHAAFPAAFLTHASVAATQITLAPQPTPGATWMPAMHLPDMASAVPTSTINTRRLALLIRSRQDLELQLEDKRRLLQQPIVQVEEPTAAPRLPEPPPVRPESLQEQSLRRQVAEQTLRLETLRVNDTDLHPDVIEAREKLARLQGELSKASHAADASRTSPAVEIPVKQFSPPKVNQQTDLMEQISLLIENEASIDREIERVKSPSPHNKVSEPAASALGVITPSPDQAAPQPTIPATRLRLSSRCIAALVEYSFALVSVSIALAAAVVVEIMGDHIPGEHALRSTELTGVAFVCAIPSMRSSR